MITIKDINKLSFLLPIDLEQVNDNLYILRVITKDGTDVTYLKTDNNGNIVENGYPTYDNGEKVVAWEYTREYTGDILDLREDEPDLTFLIGAREDRLADPDEDYSI